MDYKVKGESLTAIADAIRAKTGGADALTLAQMPTEIANIKSGGGGWGNEVGPVVNLGVEVFAIGEEILCSYEVMTVDGASYGFSGGSGRYVETETVQIGTNPSAYYTSGNKGVRNSYAMCKIVFNAQTERIVTLNCINYAEANYDYGIISAVDTMLSLDNNDDGATGSTNVIKNFKGESSADIAPIEITIPAGEHFVCVKFRKDNGTDSDNDTLKFSISV